MRSVIKFIAHGGISACNIRRRLAAYVAKRVGEFRRKGAANGYDEKKGVNGRLWCGTDDFVRKVDQIGREDCRDEIHEKCAETSVFHTQLCGCRVPKTLT